MRIAVLSGKGGTGKTLVSVNMAAVCKDSVYADCDVEEPNGHIFFKPSIYMEKAIDVLIPECDDELCSSCRRCIDFCNFNALAYINSRLMIFEEICHSCGGCRIVCPENAINERKKNIGRVLLGNSLDTTVITGVMNTGEESGVPIINEVLQTAGSLKGNFFIDCPPGSSCAVMESIKDVDFCILVTEPTILGLHDFKMVHELVQLFKKPCGVILNKCTDLPNPAKQYCMDNGINILSEIPYDPELGQLNSNGRIAVREAVRFKELFQGIADTVAKGAAG